MDELLRGVSDTALWVAMCRAMESERPDAIFHDPLAHVWNVLGRLRSRATRDARARMSGVVLVEREG